MKKKVLFGLVSLALVMLPLASGCATTSGPTIELSLAHFWPAEHFLTTEQVPDWIEEIEAATNGRVKITAYPGQTLLQAPETYDGVVNGIADIGISVFAYNRGRFPLLEAWELPGIPYVNATAAAVTAWEGYKKFMPAETSDTKVLYLFATGPGHMWTKKPVRTLEDLQGMRIRATGLSAKSLEVLGASPEAMSQPDATEALMKGVVDGNLSPTETLLGYKQAEFVDYITMTPFIYNTLFYCVMNLEKWNSLPEDVQQAFDEVNEKWAEKAGQIWDAHMQEGLDYGLIDHGMQAIELSAEETARWKALLVPLQDEYVAEAQSQGLPGREVLDEVIRLAEQYSRQYK